MKKATERGSGAFRQSGLLSGYFCPSTNRERVSLFSSQTKVRKNALFIDQSAFSNFALYVITTVIFAVVRANFNVRPTQSIYKPSFVNSFIGLLMAFSFRQAERQSDKKVMEVGIWQYHFPFQIWTKSQSQSQVFLEIPVPATKIPTGVMIGKI